MPEIKNKRVDKLHKRVLRAREVYQKQTKELHRDHWWVCGYIADHVFPNYEPQTIHLMVTGTGYYKKYPLS